MKQEELKLEKLNQSFASLKVREGSIAGLDKKEGIQKLVDGGASDDLRKAEITDLAIFRAHAAKLVFVLGSCFSVALYASFAKCKCFPTKCFMLLYLNLFFTM